MVLKPRHAASAENRSMVMATILGLMSKMRMLVAAMNAMLKSLLLVLNSQRKENDNG